MTSLQTRVVNILTKPAEEWRVIAGESDTVEGLLRNYAAPLAVIPAVGQFIGYTIVGVSVPLLGTFRYGIVRGFVSACLAFVFALVGAWIAAIVVDKLAPTFQSRGNTTQALKLVVYAMTPVWVAGVLNLVPALAFLGIIAGLPVLMGTPADKVIPYMVVSALVIIVVSVVLGSIAAGIAGVGGAFR